GKAGGGLAAYADRIGWSDDSVRQWRSAAEVVSALPDTCREVRDKARHLYEISKAPREAWPALVAALVDHEWTVADTRRQVPAVARYQIPEHHADWLPLAEIGRAHV